MVTIYFDKQLSRFMVGITVPTSFSVPNGFFTYEIEAGEYAVFQFKGLYHELNRVYRYIYPDWYTRQNRGLPYAILIGIAINPQFIKTVYDSPHYVHTLNDEYAQTENHAGLIADKLADRLVRKGYKALSQSDNTLITENTFDFTTKTSVLPHKTIAVLSGIGYIGKNNLFITTEYGAVQCLGTVLTNAPISIMKYKIKSSQCGNCNICKDVCPQKVLNGVC
ncbi:GyrI-like domain-containing protein [Bacteroides sp. AN502(2024)]|uniref:GyrI-like domain-containing protein n=1 Tax=Bacteroides sp. AN502(2024) TaxID=3160599 RepID=UPI003510DD18